MGSAIRINALGAALNVVCDDSVPPQAVQDLREAWFDLIGQPRTRIDDLPIAIAPGPRRGAQVTGVDAADLLSKTTTVITQRGISRRRGTHLLFHASGIALPDGRVIAFVGPSGQGKTTLARTLGAHFGYVTDETVAVDATDEGFGTVEPYRKPLSIGTTDAPKVQRSPSSLGLRELPAVPLRLGMLVLIERDADGPERPGIEPLDTIGALAALAPHLSYLTHLPAPLAALTRLVREAGVVRMHYREAASVADSVPQLAALMKAPDAPAQWAGGRTDRGPAAAAAASESALASAVELRATARRWAAAGDVEWVAADEGVVTLRDKDVCVLDGVGPAIWQRLVETRAADGVALGDLVDAATERFGDPGDDLARSLVESALRDLAESGLVVEFATTNDSR